MTLRLSTPRRAFGSSRPLAIDVTAYLSGMIALFICIPAVLIVGPLGASGTPAGIMGLFGFMWWLGARAVAGEGAADGPQPVRKALWFFGIAVIASFVAANLGHLVPTELRAADRGLINVLAWSGVALLAADGITSVSRLETLLRRLVVGGVFLAFLGTIEFWIGFDVASRIRIPGLVPNSDLSGVATRSIFRRVAGTASHPIEFGVVLAQVLPFAIHFAFGRRTPTRYARIALLVIGIGLPMSVSRSAVVGATAAWLTVLAGWEPAKRIRGIIATPFAVLGLRLLVPGLVGTLVSAFRFAGNDPSIQGRTDDFAMVDRYLSSSPWFGRGFGTFIPSIYPTFDNEYLTHLVQTGVVGFVALLVLFATGVNTAICARRQTDNPDTRDLAQAIAASIMVSVVGFATFDALSFPIMSLITFLMLGCAGAIFRLTRDEQAAVADLRSAPRTNGSFSS